MTCNLPSWKRTMLIARRDKLKTQIENIETVIDKAITSGHLSGIEFDSGDGKEKSTYRNLNEIRKFQESLEYEYERVLNRLLCRGVVNLGLRRYRFSNNRY